MARIVYPTTWESVSACPRRHFDTLDDPLSPEQLAGIIWHSWVETYLDHLIGMQMRRDIEEAAELAKLIPQHDDWPSLDEQWQTEVLSWVRRFAAAWQFPPWQNPGSGLWVRDAWTEKKTLLGHEGYVAKEENAIAGVRIDLLMELVTGDKPRKCDLVVVDFKTGENQLGEGSWESPGKVAQTRGTSLPHDLQLRWCSIAVAAEHEKWKRIKAGHWYVRTGHYVETSWINASRGALAVKALLDLNEDGEIVKAHNEYNRLCGEDEHEERRNEHCRSCRFGEHGDGSCSWVSAQESVARDILSDPNRRLTPPVAEPEAEAEPEPKPQAAAPAADLSEAGRAFDPPNPKGHQPHVPGTRGGGSKRKKKGVQQPDPPPDVPDELRAIQQRASQQDPLSMDDLARVVCDWPLERSSFSGCAVVPNRIGGRVEAWDHYDYRAVRGSGGVWDIWHRPTRTRLPVSAEGKDRAKRVMAAHAAGEDVAPVRHEVHAVPMDPLSVEAHGAFARAFVERIAEDGLEFASEEHNGLVDYVAPDFDTLSHLHNALRHLVDPPTWLAIEEWCKSAGLTIVPHNRHGRLVFYRKPESADDVSGVYRHHRDIPDLPDQLHGSGLPAAERVSPLPPESPEPEQEPEPMTDEAPKIGLKLRRVDKSKDRFFKILLAGPAKVGKTRAALDAFCLPASSDVAKSLIIDVEDGSRHYGAEWAFTRPMETGWDPNNPDKERVPTHPSTVIKAIHHFINNLPSSCDTLILDSMTVILQKLELYWVDIFMQRETSSSGYKVEYFKLQKEQTAVIKRETRKLYDLLRAANHNVVMISHVAPRWVGDDKFFHQAGERIDAGVGSDYEFDTVIQIERDDNDDLWARTIGDRSNRMPEPEGLRRWKWTQDALRRAIHGEDIEIEPLAARPKPGTLTTPEQASAPVDAAARPTASETGGDPTDDVTTESIPVDDAVGAPADRAEPDSEPEDDESDAGEVDLDAVPAPADAAPPEPFDPVEWKKQLVEQGVVKMLADAFDADLTEARAELTPEEWERLPDGKPSGVDLPILYGQPGGVTQHWLQEIIYHKQQNWKDRSDAESMELLRGVMRKVTGNFDIDSAKQLTEKQGIYVAKYLAMVPF